MNPVGEQATMGNGHDVTPLVEDDRRNRDCVQGGPDVDGEQCIYQASCKCRRDRRSFEHLEGTTHESVVDARNDPLSGPTLTPVVERLPEPRDKCLGLAWPSSISSQLVTVHLARGHSAIPDEAIGALPVADRNNCGPCRS